MNKLIAPAAPQQGGPIDRSVVKPSIQRGDHEKVDFRPVLADAERSVARDRGPDSERSTRPAIDAARPRSDSAVSGRRSQAEDTVADGRRESRHVAEEDSDDSAKKDVPSDATETDESRSTDTEEATGDSADGMHATRSTPAPSAAPEAAEVPAPLVTAATTELESAVGEESAVASEVSAASAPSGEAGAVDSGVESRVAEATLLEGAPTDPGSAEGIESGPVPPRTAEMAATTATTASSTSAATPVLAEGATDSSAAATSTPTAGPVATGPASTNPGAGTAAEENGPTPTDSASLAPTALTPTGETAETRRGVAESVPGRHTDGASPEESSRSTAVDAPTTSPAAGAPRSPAGEQPSTDPAPQAVVVDAAPATERGRVEAPAPTMAASATAETTGENELWGQVQRALQRARIGGDANEVRIRLRPAELGELLVQVRTQGEQIAVRLVATSSAAQQVLLDDRQRLATELADAGFDQGFVDISHDQSGRGERGGDEAGGDQSSGSFVANDAAGPRPSIDPVLPLARRGGSSINLTL